MGMNCWFMKVCGSWLAMNSHAPPRKTNWLAVHFSGLCMGGNYLLLLPPLLPAHRLPTVPITSLPNFKEIL